LAAARSGMDAQVLTGISLALASYFVFSLHDASIKWLVADFPATQILFMRSAVIVMLLVCARGHRAIVGLATSPLKRSLLQKAARRLAAFRTRSDR